MLARGILHLFRARVLHRTTLVERLRVTNHGQARLDVPLTIRLDADFADVFEVRGTRRLARGELAMPVASSETVFRYLGLDGLDRSTHVHSSRAPDRAADRSLFFRVALEPHACVELELTVACEIGPRVRSGPKYVDAVESRRQEASADQVAVISSNYGFNRWVQRSSADLRMMMTDTPHGRYPYAGIPWYSTPFGRDGLITAMALLWAAPDVARGVLTFLAETQAVAVDDAKDAQPGKIVHEMRDGEMAALGEVPFGWYYGSADATPLFVMLAHAYFERTGDLAFIGTSGPHLLAALDWMDRYGDADGDGFIEYARRSETGLIQQGWKDSWDSVFHADGSLALAPIALCEIQGYAFAAWSGAAELADARGDLDQAERWRTRARALQHTFERAFWLDDRHLCARARRRQAAVPGPHLEPGSLPVHGNRRARTRPPRGRNPDVRCRLRRMGPPHGRRRGGALQPDVVSQRLGLASRQRDGCRRIRTLWTHARGARFSVRCST